MDGKSTPTWAIFVAEELLQASAGGGFVTYGRLTDGRMMGKLMMDVGFLWKLCGTLMIDDGPCFFPWRNGVESWWVMMDFYGKRDGNLEFHETSLGVLKGLSMFRQTHQPSRLSMAMGWNWVARVHWGIQISDRWINMGIHKSHTNQFPQNQMKPQSSIHILRIPDPIHINHNQTSSTNSGSTSTQFMKIHQNPAQQLQPKIYSNKHHGRASSERLRSARASGAEDAAVLSVHHAVAGAQQFRTDIKVNSWRLDQLKPLT